MASTKENKSLLIVSVPRSASTVLEQICSKGIGFRLQGEILNKGHNKNINVPQYSKKANQFEAMKAECLRHLHNQVFRDVIQIHFISQNIDWLLERFNIIHIVRPVDEIMVSRKKLGWKMPKGTVIRHQNLLRNIPEQDGFRHLDYYNFVRDDPNKIVSILQSWYDCCNFEYMNRPFILKQGRTARVLRAHYVPVPPPKKKS